MAQEKHNNPTSRSPDFFLNYHFDFSYLPTPSTNQTHPVLPSSQNPALTQNDSFNSNTNGTSSFPPFSPFFLPDQPFSTSTHHSPSNASNASNALSYDQASTASSSSSFSENNLIPPTPVPNILDYSGSNLDPNPLYPNFLHLPLPPNQTHPVLPSSQNPALTQNDSFNSNTNGTSSFPPFSPFFLPDQPFLTSTHHSPSNASNALSYDQASTASSSSSFSKNNLIPSTNPALTQNDSFNSNTNGTSSFPPLSPLSLPGQPFLTSTHHSPSDASNPLLVSNFSPPSGLNPNPTLSDISAILKRLETLEAENKQYRKEMSDFKETIATLETKVAGLEQQLAEPTHTTQNLKRSRNDSEDRNSPKKHLYPVIDSNLDEEDEISTDHKYGNLGQGKFGSWERWVQDQERKQPHSPAQEK